MGPSLALGDLKVLSGEDFGGFSRGTRLGLTVEARETTVEAVHEVVDRIAAVLEEEARRYPLARECWEAGFGQVNHEPDVDLRRRPARFGRDISACGAERCDLGVGEKAAVSSESRSVAKACHDGLPRWTTSSTSSRAFCGSDAFRRGLSESLPQQAQVIEDSRDVLLAKAPL